MEQLNLGPMLRLRAYMAGLAAPHCLWSEVEEYERLTNRQLALQTFGSTLDALSHGPGGLRSHMSAPKIARPHCPLRNSGWWYLYSRAWSSVLFTSTASVCSSLSLSVLTGSCCLCPRPVLFFRRRFFLVALPDCGRVTSSSYSGQSGKQFLWILWTADYFLRFEFAS